MFHVTTTISNWSYILYLFLSPKWQFWIWSPCLALEVWRLSPWCRTTKAGLVISLSLKNQKRTHLKMPRFCKHKESHVRFCENIDTKFKLATTCLEKKDKLFRKPQVCSSHEVTSSLVKKHDEIYSRCGLGSNEMVPRFRWGDFFWSTGDFVERSLLLSKNKHE